MLYEDENTCVIFQCPGFIFFSLMAAMKGTLAVLKTDGVKCIIPKM